MRADLHAGARLRLATLAAGVAALAACAVAQSASDLSVRDVMQASQKGLLHPHDVAHRYPTVAVSRHGAAVDIMGVVRVWGNTSGIPSGGGVGQRVGVAVGSSFRLEITSQLAMERFGVIPGGRSGEGTVQGVLQATAYDDYACWLSARSLTVDCDGTTPNGVRIDLANAGLALKVAAGRGHGCILTPRGNITCRGQGTSYLIEGAPPGEQFVDVACGAEFTCGVLTNTSVRCFSAEPLISSLPSNTTTGFVQIAAYGQLLCGVRSGNEVQCWGTPDLNPELSSRRWTQVAVGNGVACGTTTGGVVECVSSPPSAMLSEAALSWTVLSGTGSPALGFCAFSRRATGIGQAVQCSHPMLSSAAESSSLGLQRANVSHVIALDNKACALADSSMQCSDTALNYNFSGSASALVYVSGVFCIARESDSQLNCSSSSLGLPDGLRVRFVSSSSDRLSCVNFSNPDDAFCAAPSIAFEMFHVTGANFTAASCSASAFCAVRNDRFVNCTAGSLASIRTALQPLRVLAVSIFEDVACVVVSANSSILCVGNVTSTLTPPTMSSFFAVTVISKTLGCGQRRKSDGVVEVICFGSSALNAEQNNLVPRARATGLVQLLVQPNAQTASNLQPCGFHDFPPCRDFGAIRSISTAFVDVRLSPGTYSTGDFGLSFSQAAGMQSFSVQSNGAATFTTTSSGLDFSNAWWVRVRNMTYANQNKTGTRAVAVFGGTSVVELYGAGFSNLLQLQKASTSAACTVGASAFVLFSNCAFVNNTAGRFGGAIAASSTDGNTLLIVNSTFRGNRADVRGGAVYYSCAASECVFESSGSTYEDNSVSNDDGGAVFAESGAMVIERDTFSRNAAKDGGAVAIENPVSIQVRDSIFSVNSAAQSYGALSIIKYSPGTLTVERCDFSFNSAQSVGGAVGIFSQEPSTVATLSSCTFSNNTAVVSGGAMSIESTAAALLSSCSFTRNTASLYAGAVYATSSIADSLLTVTSSNFTNNSVSSSVGGGGAIAIEAVRLCVSGSRFVSNAAQSTRGGALRCVQSDSVVVSSSSFDSNRALLGGAAHFDSVSALVVNASSSFTSNVAVPVATVGAELRGGGAISVLTEGSDSVRVSDSSFVSNSASVGGGGALYFVGPIGAVADPGGGNNAFNGNSAAWGPNFASYAASLNVLSGLLISNYTSGTQVGSSLAVALRDFYNQVVTVWPTEITVESASVVPASQATVFSGGVSRNASEPGVAYFSTLTVLASPFAVDQVTFRFQVADLLLLSGSGVLTSETVTVEMTNCSLGSQFLSSSKSCLPCDRGRFKNDTSPQQCQECANGRFQPAIGQSACEPCRAGQAAASPGASSCLSCFAGKFAENDGAATCTDCPAGKYQPGIGGSLCIECPTGSVSPPNSASCSVCQPSQIALNASLCSPCAPGTAPDSNRTSCETCAAGTFSSGSSSCQTCDVGRFATAAAASVCNNTQPGFYQPGRGASNPIACEPGSYQDDVAKTFCIVCTKGKYAANNASTTCAEAQPGHFVPSDGARAQQVCAAGYVTSSPGQSACTACSAGEYAPRNASTSCTVAREGYFVSSQGASEQQACGPGYISDTNRSTACKACDRGKYASSNTSTSCVEARSGQYVPLEGSSEEQGCAVGFYPEGQGQSACSRCPDGRVNFLPNQSSCLQCVGEGVVCSGGVARVQRDFWPYFANDGSLRASSCPSGVCTATEATLSVDASGALVLGSPNELAASSLELCTSNRKPFAENPLCGECLDGFSEWNGECVDCSEGANGLFIFFVVLVSEVFVLLLYFVNRFRGAAIAKISLYFIATSRFLLGDEYYWLGWLGLFDFNPEATTAGSTCVLPLDPFEKMGFLVLLPVFFVVLLLINMLVHGLLWGICKSRARESLQHSASLRGSAEAGGVAAIAMPWWHFSTDYYVRALLSILVFSYTSVSNATLSFLNCVQVADSHVVFDSPAIDCDSERYKRWLGAVYFLLAFPVIGFPLAITVSLWHANRRRRLGEAHVVARWGFLYEQYRAETYWWEALALLRRSGLVAISVVLWNHPLERGQAFSVFALLLLVLQLYFQPFVTVLDNRLEDISLASLCLLSILLTGQISADKPLLLQVLATLVVIAALTVFVLSFFVDSVRRIIRRASVTSKPLQSGTVYSPAESSSLELAGEMRTN